MLEFLYAFFLVRLGGNLFRNATRSPEDASKIFRYVSITFAVVSAFWIYNFFFEKNVSQKDFNAFSMIVPVLLGASGTLFYASNILKDVRVERYEETDLQFFKTILNGFVGLGLFFYVFMFINLVFGFVFIVFALMWCMLFLFTLGSVTKDLPFETFVGIPYYFFLWENNFFKFFGSDTLSFMIILVFVVIFLPFGLSLYVIFNQNSLLEKTKDNDAK